MEHASLAQPHGIRHETNMWRGFHSVSSCVHLASGSMGWRSLPVQEHAVDQSGASALIAENWEFPRFIRVQLPHLSVASV
jgi:hypothetical protein